MPEHTKLCILYLCSAAHKKITEKLHDSHVFASVFVSVLLRVSRILIRQSFALWPILNSHPCSAAPGSIPHLGQASICVYPTCVYLTAFSREREREGALPQRERGRWDRWNVGVSVRTGWCVGHVTPTLDNLVSVNAIVVITTAYTMKWQKMLTSSGSHVRCVCVMMSWDRTHHKSWERWSSFMTHQSIISLSFVAYILFLWTLGGVIWLLWGLFFELVINTKFDWTQVLCFEGVEY